MATQAQEVQPKVDVEGLEECLREGFDVCFKGFPIAKADIKRGGEVLGTGSSPKVALQQYHDIQAMQLK